MAEFVFDLDNSFQDQEFDLTLDETQFNIRLKLNRRSNCWTFDFSDSDGNVLVHGRKFVSSWDLLKQLTSLIKPAGTLLALPSDKLGLDATADTLGESVVLYYDDGED